MDEENSQKLRSRKLSEVKLRIRMFELSPKYETKPQDLKKKKDLSNIREALPSAKLSSKSADLHESGLRYLPQCTLLKIYLFRCIDCCCEQYPMLNREEKVSSETTEATREAQNWIQSSTCDLSAEQRKRITSLNLVDPAVQDTVGLPCYKGAWTPENFIRIQQKQHLECKLDEPKAHKEAEFSPDPYEFAEKINSPA
ncbi:hypothetical protein BTVI_127622 [Pitangus sulphuratus]|nr:hypothetical protein BTVI_127622 [Pitangus sulphuratus]